jgi:hypothetical protein
VVQQGAAGLYGHQHGPVYFLTDPHHLIVDNGHPALPGDQCRSQFPLQRFLGGLTRAANGTDRRPGRVGQRPLTESRPTESESEKQ